MPQAPDLGSLVGTMLAERERHIARYEELVVNLRGQIQCVHMVHLDAFRGLCRIFDAEVQRIQAADRALDPLRQSWLSCDDIPQEARQRYEDLVKREVKLLYEIGQYQRLITVMLADVSGGRSSSRPVREEVPIEH